MFNEKDIQIKLYSENTTICTLFYIYPDYSLDSIYDPKKYLILSEIICQLLVYSVLIY